MANRTDPTAKHVHGTNPQFLIEKILRSRIYANPYWKEQCFGLTAETLVDRAMELKNFGGTYAGNRKPTPFMCLILKMLAMAPEKEIVYEFILNEDYPYVRILGAFYLRLIGKPVEIYTFLEPLYADYRKLRKRTVGNTITIHVDEFIDELLTEEFSCDVILPRLPKRYHLEQQGLLEPRKSPLEDELDISSDEESSEESEDKSDTTTSDYRNYSRREDRYEGCSNRRRSKSKERRRNRRSRSRSRDRNRRSRRSRSRSRDRNRRSRSRDRNRRSRSRSRDRHHRKRSSRRRSRSPKSRRSRKRSRSRERHSSHKHRRSSSRDRRSPSHSRSPTPKKGESVKNKKTKRPRPKSKLFKDKGGKGSDTQTPANEMDEIARMNALRASLGLKPLQE